MLDIKFLRQNIDFVRRKMLERDVDIDLDGFINLDSRRRDILQEVEILRSERNRVSKGSLWIGCMLSVQLLRVQRVWYCV